MKTGASPVRVNPMSKGDSVDTGIYAGNPIGMRASGLTEMRDGCQCVTEYVSVYKKERERGVFIYFSTTKPMPMRVSGVDRVATSISVNS